MTGDGIILGGILRRWVEEENYFFWGENSLTLDGQIDITDEEQAALTRLLGDGEAWWDKK